MSSRIEPSAALAAGLALSLLAACSRSPAGSANVPDIPVYPGARLTEQTNLPDQDPIDTYTVPDVAEAEVLAWYREQMANHGWHAKTDPSDNVVLYVDEEGCWGFVMATQTTNGRDVLLQLSQQRPGTTCVAFTPAPPGRD